MNSADSHPKLYSLVLKAESLNAFRDSLDDLGSSTQSITLSRYNAWRIFGMLAVILGIPLPSKLGKLIKF
jgi:hypothetical protein